MNDQATTDLDDLMDEIARYLDAVDVFRALECEPTWRPEPGRVMLDDVQFPTLLQTSAH